MCRWDDVHSMHSCARGHKKAKNAGEVEVSMRLDAWFVGDGVHFTSILLFLIVCVFSGWGGQCGKHPDIQAKFIL